MIKYIRFLWYIIKHKWYVGIACLEIGLPLKTALLHDMSKFSKAEFKPYAENFFGNGNKQEFDKAWKHHWKVNPHHWEHWVVPPRTVCVMSTEHADEMIADWTGFGRMFGENNAPVDWYLSKYNEIKLNPFTRWYVNGKLGIKSNDFVEVSIRTNSN